MTPAGISNELDAQNKSWEEDMHTYILLPFSLCMESTSYVFYFRMVFFLSCDHDGLDSSTSAYMGIQSITSINQSKRGLRKEDHLYCFCPTNLPDKMTTMCLLCVLCVCACCVVIPFILDVRFVDIPARVTQEEGHTGFFIHLPSAVLAVFFLARKIQSFLSLVNREVDFFVLTI